MFGSLLTYLFFYVQKIFPSKGTMVWKNDIPILYQINEFKVEMDENFEIIVDNYFESFKEKIQGRFRIPKKLVEDYEWDIFFWLTMIKSIFKKLDLRLHG